MNVSLINNDSVRGLIKLEIVKSDYEAAVEKSLRSFRQKANVPMDSVRVWFQWAW